MQQQDEADQAENADSSSIAVSKTQSFARSSVNAKESLHESENRSQISPENIVNVIDKGSQQNTSLGVGQNGHQKTEHAEPPAILGQLAVQPTDTVSSLIEAVYGVYSNNHLGKVKQLNSQLTNADLLAPEDVIVFPSIPIEIKPTENNRWWIRIETKKDLVTAMQVLRAYPAELPSVRIVPFWQAAKGVQFDIISNNAFRDQAQLSDALAKIRSYFTNIDVSAFNQWAPDTIFMADPSKPIGD